MRHFNHRNLHGYLLDIETVHIEKISFWMQKMYTTAFPFVDLSININDLVFNLVTVKQILKIFQLILMRKYIFSIPLRINILNI